MARGLATAGALTLALLAAGCGPQAPEGVSKSALDEAVSAAIGAPGTCVLIGETGSGDVVYRYNTHTVCGRLLPSCQGGPNVTVDDVLKATAKGAAPRTVSCPTTPDGSRGVGWAAGPVEGKRLVYAAAMEGDTSLPGRVVADRLANAFRKAGLQPR